MLGNIAYCYKIKGGEPKWCNCLQFDLNCYEKWIPQKKCLQMCQSKSVAWTGNLQLEKCDNRFFIQTVKWGTVQQVEGLHDFQLGVINKSFLHFTHCTMISSA
jgi:hypothetical protein